MTFRALWASIAVASTLCASGAGHAQDLQRGTRAYNLGDYATALKEWRPLAERGDSRAQYNLGLMFAQGRGVKRDYAEAAKWFEKAARRGHLRAAYNLAFRYLKGEGLPRDPRAAAYWLQLAAERGLDPAQHMLGLVFAKGDGVPRDLVRAYVWLTLSARQGNKFARKDRDAVAKLLTRKQLTTARELADGMGGAGKP